MTKSSPLRSAPEDAGCVHVGTKSGLCGLDDSLALSRDPVLPAFSGDFQCLLTPT